MSTNIPTADHILECVVFDVVEGTEHDDFVDAARAVTDWLAIQPGFLGRELYEVEDRRWIDTVRWTSLDDALNAAQHIGTVASLGSFMSMIDAPTVQMMHGRPAGVGTS